MTTNPSAWPQHADTALRLGANAADGVADWALVSWSIFGLRFQCSCGHLQTIDRDAIYDRVPSQVICDRCRSW
jgi:hypothetical protein